VRSPNIAETRRFADRREAYWKEINDIIGMEIAPADLIHHAPAFAGHVNLARYLALYEAYEMTLPYSSRSTRWRRGSSSGAAAATPPGTAWSAWRPAATG